MDLVFRRRGISCNIVLMNSEIQKDSPVSFLNIGSLREEICLQDKRAVFGSFSPSFPTTWNKASFYYPTTSHVVFLNIEGVTQGNAKK
jgi:hypothetical protein